MSGPISGTIDRLEAIGIGSALKGFLVWVGGSLAGMTAILYVCGYLITTAHLYTLGLYGLVDFSKDYFLLEGAKFVLAIVIGVAQLLVGPTAILILAILTPVALVALFARRSLARRWQACRDWYAPRATSTWAYAARVGLYCVLLICCAAVGFRSLLAISFHLQIADLLYSTPDPERCREVLVSVRDAFLCGRFAPLRAAFQAQLWSALALIAMSCLAWTLIGRWRMRGWLIAPLLFVTALLTLLLPMEFGALLKPTRYPVVRIEAKGAAPEATAGEQFLIARNDKGLTVWDPAKRRVLWIPLGDVVRIETVAVRELFVPPGAKPP